MTATIFTLKTASGAMLSFTVNDYGIQLVMIDDIYGADRFNTTNTVDKDGEFYKLNENYIYDYDVNFKKDEDNNITDVTVEYRTIAKYIKETLRDENQSDKINGQQVKLMLDNVLNPEKSEASIEKIDKVIDKVIKSYQQ